MNIEQAKALVPDKDYVVYKGEMRKFLELEAPLMRLYESDGLNLLALIENCHLLGEYRGCFDSSVLPPIDEEFETCSVEVIAYESEYKTMCVIFYDFDEKKWFSRTASGDVKIYGCKKFKYCFKPDYLKI